MSGKRNYKVGGIVFGIELETPWTFMSYSETVHQRIKEASLGNKLDILPTRAGDDVPPRTFIRNRDEYLEETSKYSLDLSQYEPFFTTDTECAFNVVIKSGSFEKSIPTKENCKLIYKETTIAPHYYIYDMDGKMVLSLCNMKGEESVNVVISQDRKKAAIYPLQDINSYSLLYHFNMSMMMLYSMAAAEYGAVLIHASVIEHRDKANLFLGISGTGKSTHARLWLDNVEGSILLNDDNPVVRLEKEGTFVYGSPWSGKTPCYINKKVPVRAIISLSQAPHNKISGITGLNAYAHFISSITAIRWERSIMDNITSVSSDIAMTVPFWEMECLPDAEAAKICFKSIEKDV